MASKRPEAIIFYTPCNLFKTLCIYILTSNDYYFTNPFEL